MTSYTTKVMQGKCPTNFELKEVGLGRDLKVREYCGIILSKSFRVEL